jgi:hypothetical protein
MNKKIIYVLLCVILAPLFSGCDYSIQSVRFDFVQPPRIVYIAGVDTELDFTDATIIRTARNGSRYPEEFLLLPGLGFGRNVELIHSIDFDTPGVYLFFVQVIDEEVFYKLSNPEAGE